MVPYFLSPTFIGNYMNKLMDFPDFYEFEMLIRLRPKHFSLRRN